MKKYMMLRIASVMLVAVMMSTCAISGTFAKYVTSKEAHDSARVAKFGVTITATGTMFGKNYYNVGHSNSNLPTSYIAAAVTSVVSGNGDNVIAPGTKGSLASMTLEGTPEVDVEVTYQATLTINNAEWFVAPYEYFPLLITVGAKTFGINGLHEAAKITSGCECTDISDLITKVEAEIEGTSATYDAGTVLDDKDADSVDVSWEWLYETGADAAAKEANNEKDTELAKPGNLPEITLSITTTVTQID